MRFSIMAVLAVLLAGTGVVGGTPAQADVLTTSHIPAASFGDQRNAEPDLHKLSHRRACADPLPHQVACFAEVLQGLAIPDVNVTPDSPPPGYSPHDLQSAYSLPAAAGAGATVAIVDAYDLPAAENILSVYRSTFGLSACTTANGCFRKVDQNGGQSYPAANAGWGTEIALDIEMVSAVCPLCKILLVEAKSTNLPDLGAAVDTAVKLGARYVSNSYGASDTGDYSTIDAHYDHPGTVITAASGDSGYGSHYPASSASVTAVGGTSLNRASGTSRGWSEVAWSGAGSGCSGDAVKPAWQTDSGCTTRTVADVSAVADPNTGVAAYGPSSASGSATTAWFVAGGTSVSAPLIAGVYALAGTPSAGGYPSSYPYANVGHLYDITSGSNGSCTPSYLCTARTGPDGPTGLGTPRGVAAFSDRVVSRLAGADRFGTSAAVSAASFKAGVPVAYVASGVGFADALSGGAAAGATKGPVLLVQQSGIPSVIAAELTRLKPARIVILGGTGVVSDSVRTKLQSYTSGTVTRLAGADRYATSAKISATFPANTAVAYVAVGTGFPDALSAAPAAGIVRAPVLLVASNSIPASIAAELVRLNPARVVILGGTGAISAAVADAL